MKLSEPSDDLPNEPTIDLNGVPAENHRDVEMLKTAKTWLTPAGAAIALICFFLPWYDFSCVEQIHTQRGCDMGWPFWPIPIAAAGMLVAFGVAAWRGDPSRARPYILGLSIVLPVFLALLAYMALSEGIRFGLRPVNPGEAKYHAVRCGLVGEIFGLLTALVGTVWLRPRRRDGDEGADANPARGRAPL